MFNIEALSNILSYFPTSMYACKEVIGLSKDKFIKYVVCPQCSNLYSFKDATKEHRNGLLKSNFCSFVKFPNHSQQRMREPCGAKLMKELSTADGKKTFLYPFKVYTYQPLKSALQMLIGRQEILENLKRKIDSDTNGYSYDIYDGGLWKDAKYKDGSAFFSDKRNICLLYTSPSPRDRG